MYVTEGHQTAGRVAAPRLLRAGRDVSRNVWRLGWTSMATDISSEMITAILPLYLVAHHGFSPLAFGVVDGVQQGFGAIVRWLGGLAGDRFARHKEVAAAGYAVSAATRLAWLPAGAAVPGVATIVALDRVGKGIRTAPRDALISLSATPATLGHAFGIHRTLDAAGAMLGPFVAFMILARAPERFDLVFVTSFAAAMLGLAILFLGVENVRTGDPLGTVPRPTVAETLSPLRDVAFRRIVLGGSALALTSVSDAFLYLALREQSAVDAAVLPLLFSFTSLAYLLGSAPIGRVADHVGRARVFLAGHGLLLLAYASAGWLGGHGLWLVPVALGGYYAATDGVLNALASSHLPARLRGSGLAVLGTSTSLARLAASLGVGWVWTAVGPQHALAGFGAGLVIALGFAARTLGTADSRTGREPSR